MQLSLGTLSASITKVLSGYWGAGSDTNTIDYANLSNETATRLSATLHSNRAGAGASDKRTRGYFFGGFIGCCTVISTVTRMLFSNQTTGTVTAMSTATYGRQALESNVSAYATGGDNAGAYPNAVDKYNFSNDARSTLSGDSGLGQTRNGGGFSSSISGYFTSGLANINTVNKYLFSNDTRSTTTSLSISTNNLNVDGFQSSIAGYASIGTSAIDKFMFSNDSRTTLSFLPNSNTGSADSVSSDFSAYSNHGGSGSLSKLQFATETYTVVSNVLQGGKSDTSAFEGV
jgi:hypothetical protein